ncbi:MAG: Ankyrin repeat domain-containing protein 44 [Vezdaea acicularis]|nr:MAG: Ankyrin repeat domain-containing protein 44 [Vezdaea acicularis]
MADPLSTTASIIAILQLSSVIVKYIKEVRDAANEKSQLFNEIINARGELLRLKDLIELSELENPWMYAVQDLGKPEGPIELYKLALERVAKRLGIERETKKDFQRIRTITNTLKWPFQSGEIKDIIALLERQRSVFALALQMDHLALSNAMKNDVKETRALVRVMTSDVKDVRTDVKTILQRTRDENQMKILEWLSSLQPQRKHLEVDSRRIKGTGDWFLQLPAFQTWKNPSMPENVFCCKGIPGAGKTVISSLVIEHLSRDESVADVALGFLYCDYREQDPKTGQNVRQMSGSLLKQILSTRKELPKALVDLYNNERASGDLALITDFEKIIVDLCNERTTYIIVDALDECDPTKHRPTLLKLLTALEKSRARVLLTSRPNLKDIERHMRKFIQATIEASDNDISTMLALKIEQHIEEDEDMEDLIDDGLKEEIISALVGKAQGMFLLPSLQVQTVLQKSTPAAIREAIRDLPKTLYEEFQLTLDRIHRQPEDKVSFAMSILMWISHARNRLTVAALRHALAVRFEDKSLENDNLTPIRIFTSSITDSCQGLVMIDADSSLVRLVHFSLQEFFESLQSLFPTAQEAIAKTCLTYCLFDACGDGPSPNDESFERFEAQYPFFVYASSQWAFHSHQMTHDYESPDVTTLSKNLLSQPSRFEKTVQCLWMSLFPTTQRFGYSQKYSRGYTPLHHASSYGLGSLVVELCNSGADIDAVVKSGFQAGWNVLHYLADTYITDPVAASYVGFLVGRGKDMVAPPDTSAPLHIAATKGRVETIRALLQGGADISVRDENGLQPIHVAGRNGNTEIIQLLLEYGADTSSKTTHGQTPLVEAILNNNEGAVKYLLSRGVDANEKCTGGEPPLVLACFPQNIAIVNLLIDAGAGLNLGNDNNVTPLMMATQNPSIMRLLIEKGADVRIRTKANDSALLFAAQKGLDDAVQLLLDEGAELNGKHELLDTALMVAARKKHDSTVHLLLRQDGIEVDAVNEVGNTALHFAIGSESTARLLMDVGNADLNISNDSGLTPLLCAAAESEPESAAVMRLLLRSGALVNTPDLDRVSALHLASELGSVEKVKILLEYGIDANAKDGTGSRPLQYAMRTGKPLEIVQLLLDHGADIKAEDTFKSTVTHSALDNKCESMVRFLLDHGAPVDIQNNVNNAPLHLAADHGMTSVVELLLQRGANVQAKGNEGNSPLHLAAREGDLEAVQLLLAAGADVAATNDGGFQAGTLAAENGHVLVLKLLLDRGADMNNIGVGIEQFKCNSLLLASQNGHEDVVRLLLGRGVSFVMDPDDPGQYNSLHSAAGYGYTSIVSLFVEKVKDLDLDLANSKSGKTPLQLAVMNGHEETVTLLLASGANIDARSNIGTTALFHAVGLENEETALKLTQLLLDHGADINARSLDQATLLHIAASAGHVSIAEILLGRDLLIDIEGEFGCTPIYVAALCGNKAFVEYCIEQGADVTKGDNMGNTALHVALTSDVAEIILQRPGMDINMLSSESRETPLNRAVYLAHKEAVRFFLDKGADLNTSDKWGEVPLHSANDVDIARILLEAGAAVDVKAENSKTPLIRAVDRGNEEIVRLFLDSGADIQTEGPAGMNALYAATMGDDEAHEAIYRLLINRGIDINHQGSNGWTVAHAVAWSEQLKYLKIICEAGADIDIMNNIECTPFHHAVMKGNSEMIEYLLDEMNFDLKKKRDEKVTLLALVFGQGDEKRNLHLLLDRGADIEGRDSYGRTPLISCSAVDRPQAIKMLLDAGADINATFENGGNALFVAIRNSCEGNISMLLEYGADPFHQDGDGANALHMAAYSNESIMQLLISKGVPLNAAAEKGVTPLHLACESGNPELVHLLLEAGAPVNVGDDLGQTTLHVAAAKTNSLMAQALIAKGAVINVHAKSGVTPLHYAAAEGGVDVVRLLLDNGADVDSRSSYSRTPLVFAAMAGHLDVVRVLLQAKADLTAKDNGGEDVLTLTAGAGELGCVVALLEAGADVHAEPKAVLRQAVYSGNLDVVKAISQAGAEINNTSGDDGMTALMIAALTGRADIVAHLLSLPGINVGLRNQKGCTALFLAAQAGCLLAVKELAAAGADLHERGYAKIGYTPLAIAVRRGRLDVASWLLDRGAQVETVTQNGNTPLHHAISAQSEELITLLLDRGADINHQDKQGDTALLNAMGLEKCESICELLVERGADIDIKNEEGINALGMALTKGKAAVVKMLLDKGANARGLDGRGKSTLQLAVEGGSEASLRVLMEKRNHLDYAHRNGAGETAEEMAVRRGEEGMVEMFKGRKG